MPPKKKKKKTPILVDDPDEKPEDISGCLEVMDAKEEVPEVPPEVEELPVVEEPCPDCCPKCGLPKADFDRWRAKLRPDLRKAAAASCPRCAEPT